MEKALAAMHQSNRERMPVTFAYGVHEGRVGLSVRFSSDIEELVTGPIVASYPQCSLETVEEVDGIPAGWTT